MAIYKCFKCDQFIDDDYFPCEDINDELYCPDCAPEANIRKALTNLVHLHHCEMEGIGSGKPSPTDWMKAVSDAEEALGDSEVSNV